MKFLKSPTLQLFKQLQNPMAFNVPINPPSPETKFQILFPKCVQGMQLLANNESNLINLAFVPKPAQNTGVIEARGIIVWNH